MGAYSPRFGKFAVLGNHDLWTDDKEICRQLSESGVEVLVNRNVPLAFPFDGISICGIDDPWTGCADSAKAFDGAKSVRIWLTHSPDGLLVLDNQQYTVGFAGHTHGARSVFEMARPSSEPVGLCPDRIREGGSISPETDP
jgi:predicted MPP superfamily phosphohydrolase